MSFLQLSCKPGEWYANAQYYYNGTIYFFLAIVCTLSHLRQSFMCNATLLNGTRLEKNRLIIPQHNLSNQNIRVQILSILLWESDYRILIFYMKRLLRIIYIYIRTFHRKIQNIDVPKYRLFLDYEIIDAKWHQKGIW